ILANQRRGIARRTNLANRLALALETVRVVAEPDLAAGVADRAVLARALVTLVPDDREMILLSVWEELTPADIAVAYGIPATTARSRLHRARARLRTAILAQELDERRAAPGHLSGDGHVPAQSSPKEVR
ncbi:MAG: RNA polymerase subunit sigma-24, partial [Actinobacteria bacterium]|nr:RNA polymerase subunit sigma-24 [Actinomycetota bacterium]